MRIISLNIWGGRAGKEELLSFFSRHAPDTDIFCLQEVWSDRYKVYEGSLAGGVPLKQQNVMTRGMQEISEVLSDHTPLFRPHFMDNFGLLMLVSKKFSIQEEGECFVYKEKGYIPDGDIGNNARNIQYATVESPLGTITAMNFHGLWNGKGKDDCQERLAQSENILAFLRTLKNPYVFCGDFNLHPNTESLKKLERLGLRNLVAEYGVTSTRTSLYTKPEKFADYVFVSPGIEVTAFEVLPDEVSDHAPLMVEIG